MRFCPNCGIPVGESPRYCAGCGTQVIPVGAPPVTPFGADPVGAPAGGAAVGGVPGRPESWLPAELSATRGGQPGSPSGARPASVSTPPTRSGVQSPGTGRKHRAGWSRRWAGWSRRWAGWSGHRMTITAMSVTLALVGTAGVAVWQVSQVHAQPSMASDSMRTQPTGLATGSGHRGSTQPAAHGSAPLPRASAKHRLTRPAPAAPAGNAVVAVAPLAADVPDVRPVVALLTTYFESINSQNFAEYQSLFVPSIQRTMTHFGSGYAGTFDSGATLTQLVATGPHGLAATVAFISHQNPANSPDGAGCDSWLITLFLKRQGNALRIRPPRPGFPQSVLACH